MLCSRMSLVRACCVRGQRETELFFLFLCTQPRWEGKLTTTTFLDKTTLRNKNKKRTDKKGEILLVEKRDLARRLFRRNKQKAKLIKISRRSFEARSILPSRFSPLFERPQQQTDAILMTTLYTRAPLSW